MTKYLVQKFLWFRERGFVQITQKTLVSLFPFLLFSAIIRVISQSFFSDRGYINMLFLSRIGSRGFSSRVRSYPIYRILQEVWLAL